MLDRSKYLVYDMGDGVEAFSTCRDVTLPYDVVQAHQVHGTRVAVIDRPGVTRDELEGYDALVTDRQGIAIGARTADCIPVLLADRHSGVIAAVHSGWRGTAARISAVTIDLMRDRFGCNPADIRAIIGPGIRKESFQVGGEVVVSFQKAGFDMDRIWRWNGPAEDVSGGHHIDLIQAVKDTLTETGVMSANILDCGIDTFRSPEFYSARREGTKCGRIINSICFTDL